MESVDNDDRSLFSSLPPSGATMTTMEGLTWEYVESWYSLVVFMFVECSRSRVHFGAISIPTKLSPLAKMAVISWHLFRFFVVLLRTITAVLNQL